MAKTDFPGAFAALKPLFSRYADRLKVTIDSEGGYSVSAKSPSPFPRHKGEPLFFGAVRSGKAYVGFHLMPLYICPALLDMISPALKKRMQGKTCFNFKAAPQPDLLAELNALTEASFRQWDERQWL